MRPFRSLRRQKPCNRGDDRKDTDRQPFAVRARQPDHQRGHHPARDRQAVGELGEQDRCQGHEEQQQRQDRTPVEDVRVKAEHELAPPLADHGPAGTMRVRPPGRGDRGPALGQRIGVPDRVQEPRQPEVHEVDDDAHTKNGQDRVHRAGEQVFPQPLDRPRLRGGRRLRCQHGVADEGNAFGMKIAHLNAPSAGRRCCRRSSPTRSAG